MHRIKIRLPATLTNLGPGLGSLGLALGLYTTVEISARDDEKLVVETEGEGAGRYAIGLRHPVVLALMRIFQKLEHAPLGITIKIDNRIPLSSGLGAEEAFMIAGVIGANNLMGNIYSRGEVLELAADVTKQPNSLASALGGLVACAKDEESLLYRTLPLTPLKIIIAVPVLDDYEPPSPPDEITREDAAYNLNHLPLMVDALREGDIELLARVVGDKLHTPLITPNITGYAHIAEVARLAGALAVTTSGDGPAMVFLAKQQHARIMEAIENAFANLEIPAQTWILPLDTQGVVISVAQSA